MESFCVIVCCLASHLSLRVVTCYVWSCRFACPLTKAFCVPVWCDHCVVCIHGFQTAAAHLCVVFSQTCLPVQQVVVLLDLGITSKLHHQLQKHVKKWRVHFTNRCIIACCLLSCCLRLCLVFSACIVWVLVCCCRRACHWTCQELAYALQQQVTIGSVVYSKI